MLKYVEIVCSDQCCCFTYFNAGWRAEYLMFNFPLLFSRRGGPENNFNFIQQTISPGRGG